MGRAEVTGKVTRANIGGALVEQEDNGEMGNDVGFTGLDDLI